MVEVTPSEHDESQKHAAGLASRTRCGAEGDSSSVVSVNNPQVN